MGEEFPADCLGARHLCQCLLQGNLALRLRGGGLGDLSRIRVQGVHVLDMVAALGLKYTVGFNWQKLDPQIPDAIFNEQMSAAERQQAKKRLSAAGVKLPACYCRKLDAADACRRLFDFCREMGIETIDGEPPFEPEGTSSATFPRRDRNRVRSAHAERRNGNRPMRGLLRQSMPGADRRPLAIWLS
jgi:hypothetical protein